jgi:hypothetical protein
VPGVLSSGLDVSRLASAAFLVGQQGDVQGGAGLRVGEADAEDALDESEPLVERGPGKVRARGGEGLVAAGLKEGRQVGDQGGPVPGVVGEQRAQFPLGERAQPWVLAQQVQQAPQPQVR